MMEMCQETRENHGGVGKEEVTWKQRRRGAVEERLQDARNEGWVNSDDFEEQQIDKGDEEEHETKRSKR